MPSSEQNPTQKRPQLPIPPTKMPSTEQNPNQKRTQLPTPPTTKEPQNDNNNKPQGLEPVPTSWADRVRVTNSSTRHTLEAIPQQPLGSRLMIPAGMKMLNVDHWSRCMIGCFTGYRIPYHAVNLIARKVWDSYGLEQVLTVADGFFIFRFKSEEDVLEIIEKGPWMFGDASIPFIRQFEVESPLSKVPVKVTVEYEWKPSRCEACQSFGHKCPAMEKTKVGGEKLTDGEHQHTSDQAEEREEPQPPADNSPWRQIAEGARQRSRSRPKHREGKQPWIDVSPSRRATKKVADPGLQVSGPVMQKIQIKQVSESSKQSTVGADGQNCAASRKANQLCCGDMQGHEGTPNVDLDVETGVEEEGSSKPSGSHVSTEGDEATTTSPAWVTCDVLSKADGSSIRVTFVYGLNLPVDPHGIVTVGTSIGILIWMSIHLVLLRRSSFKFLYRLLSTWSASKAEFQARLASDHSPIVLSLVPPSLRQKARFKFLNLWTKQEGYEEAVRAAWAVEVHGNPISRLTSKLRILKGFLKSKLGHHTHDISHKVIMAKEKWHAVQRQLDRNPRDQDIKSREREACYLYNKLNADAESFFKQRSRVQWLKLGDKNTAYFHRSLLHRRARNHIHSFTSDTGEVVREPMEMGNMAANYFQTLLTDPSHPADNRIDNSMYTETECNKRIFQQLSQPAATVGEAIFQVIRDQIMSSNGISLADGTRAIWNIPWPARPLRDTGHDRPTDLDSSPTGPVKVSGAHSTCIGKKRVDEEFGQVSLLNRKLHKYTPGLHSLH
ncbi:hypothetical protein DKX38_000854 [Salix brachista]|uniref:DUF4283 domain-containing protein n=1 Tax=Salix brachista TaxID=2182728 RepID=A0A5N5P1K7_9ROSI|nr:hypothetical protein DKX38_000854 [Salix brachista]